MNFNLDGSDITVVDRCTSDDSDRSWRQTPRLVQGVVACVTAGRLRHDGGSAPRTLARSWNHAEDLYMMDPIVVIGVQQLKGLEVLYMRPHR